MSAAEESTPEIGEHLDGAHMVFITAGMGGGTGTGAAPIIAKCARERGILTVGVVTKPFHFEGRHRMRLADAGIAELQRYVDTLIVIPNQNLFRVANERTTFAEAFGMADQVLHSGVRSITDLMVLPGLINLDFADVRTVMTEMGKAMMGTGEASGDDRALMAAQNAIHNPLLDEVSLKGAKAVLVNITGGLDMTLLEVDEAANAITDQVDPEANVIFGAAFDPALEGSIRVSVVATGMDGAPITAIEPQRTSGVNTPAEPLIVDQVQHAPTPAYEAPAAEAAPAPELVIQTPRRTVIVDPLVEQEEIDTPRYGDSRRQRKGFLSLFGGRPRQDPSSTPAAQAHRPTAARPRVVVEPQEDDSDDLEIPSFLRRLASTDIQPEQRSPSSPIRAPSTQDKWRLRSSFDPATPFAGANDGLTEGNSPEDSIWALLGTPEGQLLGKEINASQFDACRPAAEQLLEKFDAQELVEAVVNGVGMARSDAQREQALAALMAVEAALARAQRPELLSVVQLEIAKVMNDVARPEFATLYAVASIEGALKSHRPVLVEEGLDVLDGWKNVGHGG